MLFSGDNIKTALHVAKQSMIINQDQFVVEVIASEPKDSEIATVRYEINSYPSSKVGGQKYFIKKKKYRVLHADGLLDICRELILSAIPNTCPIKIFWNLYNFWLYRKMASTLLFLFLCAVLSNFNIKKLCHF